MTTSDGDCPAFLCSRGRGILLEADARGHILQLLADWMAQGKVTGTPDLVKEVLHHIAFVGDKAELGAGHSEATFIRVLEQSSQASAEQYQSSAGDFRTVLLLLYLSTIVFEVSDVSSDLCPICITMREFAQSGTLHVLRIVTTPACIIPTGCALSPSLGGIVCIAGLFVSGRSIDDFISHKCRSAKGYLYRG